VVNALTNRAQRGLLDRMLARMSPISIRIAPRDSCAVNMLCSVC
jgi:hypothetical protein